MAPTPLSPTHWPAYELIDTGGSEKLERFGEWILARPEPQALWDKALPEEEWEKRCHAHFRRDKSNPEKGEWKLKKGMPEQWFIDYKTGDYAFRMRLGLTSFKHVGVFPEQSVNWDFIWRRTRSIAENTGKKPRILNLFAYTGGASLAACSADAEVTHVDSVRPVITWARQNMEASRLDGIRWIVDDAMKFVLREVRRGNSYEGIILDPPAYGRGPDGEKWVLDDHLNDLLKACRTLLVPDHRFFLVNLYSMGFSSLLLESLIRTVFPEQQDREFGDLFIPDNSGRKLPLGIFLRFS